MEEIDEMWNQYLVLNKELQKIKYHLFNQDYNQQGNVLLKAIGEGYEKYVLEYLLTVEPLNYGPGKKALTINLLYHIIDLATFPNNNELTALAILVDLVRFDDKFIEIISLKAKDIMFKANSAGDYEIIERIGNLLYDIKSPMLSDFIVFCQKSVFEDIRDVAGQWE